MFDNLSDKLQEVFRNLRGQAKLTEENMGEALRQVRRALLEADVALPVVKGFIARVKEQALGHEVLQGVSPGQQFIKIVHDEMVALLGGERAPLANQGVILMAGLQGSGKTTTAGKLARHLKKQGKRPYLVACDVYRPAAAEQLRVLGKQVEVPVYAGDGQNPVKIAQEGVQAAKAAGHDLIIIDTAGRLHIDDALMDELKQIREAVHPQEILLVVDSMMGQDAVKMAEQFHQTVPLTGVVLTKLDGDTRGGAALSVKETTGCPIKFAATGEKLDALEPFHPDRIATRILGMGDVLTLVEKAQEVIDEKSAREMEQKFRRAEFTLEDFLEQMKQVKKLGSLDQIFGMLPIPGLNKIDKTQLAEGEKQMKQVEAIISSMTPGERREPNVLNGSRKQRIAKGSGTTVQAVNKLLKDFEQMQKMVKMLSGSGLFPGGGGKRKGKLKFPGGFPFQV